MTAIRKAFGKIGVQVGLCAALFAVLLAVLGGTAHQGFSSLRVGTTSMAQDQLPENGGARVGHCALLA